MKKLLCRFLFGLFSICMSCFGAQAAMLELHRLASIEGRNSCVVLAKVAMKEDGSLHWHFKRNSG